MFDYQLEKLIGLEKVRQNNGIELIASENYPSRQVLDACGSIAICKYAEGYPGHRYYGGCDYIDAFENLAIDRLREVFCCGFVNVQPHCGSSANMAAYHALMPNGGKILSLDLNSGGHLTHGSPVSFSSHEYQIVHYPLDKNGRIDYDEIERLAYIEEPTVILAGASAYPYIIDFERFGQIRDKINDYYQRMNVEKHCYLMADIAHIAGLVAAKRHPSPFPWCDVVTSTTHKTLRGPRGGIIMWNNPLLTKRINSAVFPYLQGGPLENIIAGKAVMAYETMQPQFVDYIDKVLVNTKTAADTMREYGAIVSDTENHLFLVDTLNSFGMTGLDAQKKLEDVGITTNKNMLPNDTQSPAKTSGLRIGLAAATTRGITQEQIKVLFTSITLYLQGKISREEIRNRVVFMSQKLLDIGEIRN